MAALRGRTSSGRLRGLDAYLVADQPALLTSPGGLFVDLGFGERPDTTLELAATIHAANPSARILGLDLEPHRVAAAPQDHPSISFREGGFDYPFPEPPRLIRAMNVLRSYRAEEVEPARQRLLAALSPDGLLLEGSCDPSGDVLTAYVLRPDQQPFLLFFTSFARGFSPWMFRDYLPRDLRRDVRPGTPIHALLTEWHAAWEASRPGPPDALFARSVRETGLRLISPGLATTSPAGSASGAG